ncbi:hypothetical protein [Oceanobacillus oncorhynchi]|uniref:hypothetical protein n=1 Tax=Oceanobacillus oncorhynchi TaxID=545501 RepID=UPI0034D3E8EF
MHFGTPQDKDGTHGTIKKIGAYAIGIFIFCVLVTGIVDESKNLYQLLQDKGGHEKEVTVVGKTVSSDLIGKLKYYVRRGSIIAINSEDVYSRNFLNK